MTTVETTHDKLLLTVQGFDIILALKHRLEIPLTHVLGAEVGVTDEVRERLSHSLRLPGTHLPGIITAGSYAEHGRWMFWDIRSGKSAVTIRITHEKYDRIVVDVADPASTVAAITTALAAIARHP
ncbi:MAG: hypothetical protein JWN44_6449 [Myxococcales bacterium]|nr:hypothetical protein [Myxococcales bacterium]